jgi:hypothetical protein
LGRDIFVSRAFSNLFGSSGFCMRAESRDVPLLLHGFPFIVRPTRSYYTNVLKTPTI